MKKILHIFVVLFFIIIILPIVIHAATLPNAHTYPVDEGPLTITSGDLNSDTFPDLLTANLVNGTLSILFNDGDGTFDEPYTPVAVGPTRDAEIADMTGDGIPDIVTHTANLGGAILVSPGLGNGTFFSAIETPLGLQGITSIEVSDLNADGDLDVQVYYESLGILKILIGNGDGTFEPPVDVPGSLPPETDTITVDLNADGILDTARAVFALNVVEVTLNGTSTPALHPSTKDQCKGAGYKNYVDDIGQQFKNQGLCVKYVNNTIR
jgi:hypothetical protein